MSVGTAFDNLIGHRGVLGKLEHIIRDGSVGHAYIFYGPEGVGKATAARAFALDLLCPEPGEDGRRCGRCQACRLADSGTNPDLYEIRPEKDVVKVDAIREMQADMILNPLYSARKVCLIDDAHLMNTQAQNCLLKTLEEPPSYAVLILAAADYGALLETVRSRAVALAFGRLTAAEVRQYLERNHPELKNPAFLAAYSQGSIGAALRLGLDEKYAALRDAVFETASALAAVPAALRDENIFERTEFLNENKDSIGDVLGMLALTYRDALVYAVTGDEGMLINTDKKYIIFDIAGKIPPSRLENAIKAIDAADTAIGQNANFTAAVEAMLLRIGREFGADG